MMIYFLPGMGATSEMYSEEWKVVENSIFIDWPNQFPGVSIGDVAEFIIEQNSIGEGDQVVGTSLGGIVAAEISVRSNVCGTVVISGSLGQ